MNTGSLKAAEQPPGWRNVLPGLLIFLLVAAAYFPAVNGQFIWDDDYNVIKSAPLRSLAGLLRIWFEPGATQQYYPLTHTSFWLDYHLWGLHPLAYHVENILLHACTAVLLWRVLRRLEVRGAWLGAALFALHPVCVESVAWITERKNTLSGVFFIGSLLMAAKYWLPRGPVSIPGNKPKPTADPTRFGAGKFYWLALGLYLCALWSKTATVCLPGVILLLAWWKRGRLVRRDALLIAPFLALGLGMALITISVEKHLMVVGGNPDEWCFSTADRLLIAGRAVWFYLGKLAWPYPLMFVYPHWDIHGSPWTGCAAVAAALAGVFILWQKRQSWGRPVLAAAGFFVLMLLPMLGFFNVYFFRYSFVCDHFQYLAAMGPLALAGTGITLAADFLFAHQPRFKPVLPGALLLSLGLMTGRHTQIFQNLETLWRDSIARNPQAWMARDNLGIYLSGLGRFAEADQEYNLAIQWRPGDYVAYYDLGLEAAIEGKLDAAAQYFTKSLAYCPSYAMADYNLGNILTRKGDFDGAIQEYQKTLQTYPNLAQAHFNLGNALVRKGKVEQAAAEYSRTLQLEPDFAPAAINLGNMLTDEGKIDDAVEQFNLALQLQPKSAEAHTGLGRALAAQGNENGAIMHYLKALEIDPNSVEATVNLGNASLKKGWLDEAVEYYQTALRLAPGNPLIHRNLAVAFFKQGKSAEGQAELDQADQLNAKNAAGQ